MFAWNRTILRIVLNRVMLGSLEEGHQFLLDIAAKFKSRPQ